MLTREPARACGQSLFQLGFEISFLFTRGVGENGFTRLSPRPKQNIHGRVTAIIENHIGSAAIRPVKGAVDIVPIFGQSLTFFGEHWHTCRGNRCGGLILG